MSSKSPSGKAWDSRRTSVGCPGTAPICWRLNGDGIFMRLFFAVMLTALLWALTVAVGHNGASAKIVCGQTDQGFKCRNESGAVRRGKMGKVPGASSGGASEGATGGAANDALPPSSPDAGASAPSAAPSSCPRNTELLGGTCVRYTVSCRSGVPANAHVPPCRSADEKLVCKIGSDGLRHCCCQLYDKH